MTTEEIEAAQEELANLSNGSDADFCEPSDEADISTDESACGSSRRRRRTKRRKSAIEQSSVSELQNACSTKLAASAAVAVEKEKTEDYMQRHVEKLRQIGPKNATELAAAMNEFCDATFIPMFNPHCSGKKVQPNDPNTPKQFPNIR